MMGSMPTRESRPHSTEYYLCRAIDSFILISIQLGNLTIFIISFYSLLQEMSLFLEDTWPYWYNTIPVDWHFWIPIT